DDASDVPVDPCCEATDVADDLDVASVKAFADPLPLNRGRVAIDVFRRDAGGMKLHLKILGVRTIDREAKCRSVLRARLPGLDHVGDQLRLVHGGGEIILAIVSRYRANAGQV